MPFKHSVILPWEDDATQHNYQWQYDTSMPIRHLMIFAQKPIQVMVVMHSLGIWGYYLSVLLSPLGGMMHASSTIFSNEMFNLKCLNLYPGGVPCATPTILQFSFGMFYTDFIPYYELTIAPLRAPLLASKLSFRVTNLLSRKSVKFLSVCWIPLPQQNLVLGLPFIHIWVR